MTETPLGLSAAALLNLGAAVLGGLAVGIERQWSGKAEGPSARFGGLRTFTMLGLVSGLSGWLWSAGLTGPSSILLAGLGALVVIAYSAASRVDIDGTTEVAAFVVLAAGVLSGAGYVRAGSAIVAITVLLLVEKTRLHGWVRKLDREEVRAGARFAVMAAVVLPLLPEGPFGPLGGVRPRQLWALVLFFSGLSFLGYLAQRVAGPQRGYAIAGTLGGLLSSTSVTLTFSRLSQEPGHSGRALAAGVLGANVMLFPRVLVATLVLEPALARALWPALVAPAMLGAALATLGLRDDERAGPAAKTASHPLQLGTAIKMALLFQLVLFAVAFANARFGAQGLYGSAALLGLSDVDALTISMARLVSSGTAAALVAGALTVGIFANTVVKLAIALALGRGTFRRLSAAGLALIAAALAAGGVWLRG
jgi:uncharacterized membrane protein (DUF4010 family)